MGRPLRIEFPGAVNHPTACGNRREDIFVDDGDRQGLLAIVARALSRFDAEALAYCLMGNHYHFVLRTRQGNLSLLMPHINGVYTQTYNRRHHKVGELLQGRFKAIPVDRDAYLLEVCRYVDRNPVAWYPSPRPGPGRVTGRTWDKRRCMRGRAPPACTATCRAGRRRVAPIGAGRPLITSGWWPRCLMPVFGTAGAAPADLSGRGGLRRAHAGTGWAAEQHGPRHPPGSAPQVAHAGPVAGKLRESGIGTSSHRKRAQYERDCTRAGVVGVAREPADRTGGGGQKARADPTRSKQVGPTPKLAPEQWKRRTVREWFWPVYWAPELGKCTSVGFSERAYGKECFPARRGDPRKMVESLAGSFSDFAPETFRAMPVTIDADGFSC